jgi:hypothetical protein
MKTKCFQNVGLEPTPESVLNMLVFKTQLIKVQGRK